MAGLFRAGLVEVSIQKFEHLRLGLTLSTTSLNTHHILDKSMRLIRIDGNFMLDPGLGQGRLEGCNFLHWDGLIGSAINS